MKLWKMLSLTLVFTMLIGVISVTAQETIDLTVTWWGSQTRHERTIQAISLFESENPNVHVTFEFSGWTDYWTRVNTQASAGSVACVMQQDYQFVTEWARRGLLLPLDEFIATGVIDTRNVANSIIQSGSVDGTPYAISLGTNSQVYILDAAAFEAAGIEMPEWDWTLDDWEAISNQFAAQGMWGIAYGPWDEAVLKSILLSDGQQMFAEDGSALAIEDSSVLTSYLERIQRMMQNGAIASMEMQADFTGTHEESPIVQGREAMRYLWSNQVVSLYAAAGENRDFVLYPLPRLANGVTPNYLKPSQFFSITENCENPQVAAQFIDFVTNSLEANDILFAERGVPISSAVLSHLSGQVDPVNRKIFDFIAQVSEIAIDVPAPDPVGYSDITNNVLTPEFVEPVLFGLISADQGYAAFESGASVILANAMSGE